MKMPKEDDFCKHVYFTRDSKNSCVVEVVCPFCSEKLVIYDGSGESNMYRYECPCDNGSEHIYLEPDEWHLIKDDVRTICVIRKTPMSLAAKRYA